MFSDELRHWSPEAREQANTKPHDLRLIAYRTNSETKSIREIAHLVVLCG